MRRLDDSHGEMVRTMWLDRGTADRLLAGSIAPDDAPPGYTDVVRLLRLVATPPSPRELATEAEAIATAETILRARPAALPTPARSGARHRRWRRTKVTGLVLVGAMSTTSGLAVAGVLPDDVQSAASRVLDAVGIDAPDPTRDEQPTELEHPASSGEAVSEIATTTESEGVDKGAEISGAASGGVSRAGEEHGPPEDPGGSSAKGEQGGNGDKGAEVSEAASGGRGPAGSGGPPSR